MDDDLRARFFASAAAREAAATSPEEVTNVRFLRALSGDPSAVEDPRPWNEVGTIKTTIGDRTQVRLNQRGTYMVITDHAMRPEAYRVADSLRVAEETWDLPEYFFRDGEFGDSDECYLVLCEGHGVMIWNLKAQRITRIESAPGFKDTTTHMRMMTGNRYSIAMQSRDVVTVTNWGLCKVVKTIPVSSYILDFAVNKTTVAVSSARALELYNIDSDESSPRTLEWTKPVDRVWLTEQYCIALDVDGRICVYTLVDGVLLHQIPPIWTLVCPLPDGERMAVVKNTHRSVVMIVRIRDLKPLSVCREFEKIVGVECSADGRRLAVVQFDGRVRVMELPF